MFPFVAVSNSILHVCAWILSGTSRLAKDCLFSALALQRKFTLRFQHLQNFSFCKPSTCDLIGIKALP